MRIRVFALLVLVVVGSAAAPDSALANRSAKKAIWGPVTRAGKSEFPVYQRLGVDIFEMDLNWARIAPTQPRKVTNPADAAYQWPPDVAYAIRQASRYHMRVLLHVIGTPRWANGGRAWNYPPTQIGSFAQFLAVATRRYPSVHLWLIWGEPDRRHNFALVRRVPASARRLTPAQAVAPHVYARMLDASYTALKTASKRNLVIGGNTYTWGDIPVRLWIENLRLPNGRPPHMDLYGHNPFSYRHPDLANPPSPYGAYDFSDLGRLYQLVNRHLKTGPRPIKLFLPEWTIPTSPRDSEFPFWVEPRVAAQWITDAWQIVRETSFIYALGWIHVYDDPPGRGSSGGLFNYRGHPKPLYYAFKAG